MFNPKQPHQQQQQQQEQQQQQTSGLLNFAPDMFDMMNPRISFQQMLGVTATPPIHGYPNFPQSASFPTQPPVFRSHIPGSAHANSQSFPNHPSTYADSRLQAALELIPDQGKPYIEDLFKQLQEGKLTQEQFVASVATIASRNWTQVNESSLSLVGDAPSDSSGPPTPEIGNIPTKAAKRSSDAPMKRQIKRPKTDQSVVVPETTNPKAHPASKKTEEGFTTDAVDVNKLDVTSMMDVTAYAGVDLKEEEDIMANVTLAMQPHHSFQARRSINDTIVSNSVLRRKLESIVAEHGLDGADEECVTRISLSIQYLLRNLLDGMATGAKHRVGIGHDRFIKAEMQSSLQNGNGLSLSVKVAHDPKIALEDLVMADKESERQAKSLLYPSGGGKSKAELNREASAQEPSSTGAQFTARSADSTENPDDVSMEAKKKPKKKAEQSESVKARLANSTAVLAAGGKRAIKSWMLPQNKDKGPSSTSSQSVSKKKEGETNGRNDETIYDTVGLFIDESGNKVQLGRAMSSKEMSRITLKDAVTSLASHSNTIPPAFLIKWCNKMKI